MSYSDIIRKFERFLFKGIPDQPEHIYERDDHAHAGVRFTGKSLKTSIDDIDENIGEVIGTYHFDFEKKTVDYKPVDEQQ